MLFGGGFSYSNLTVPLQYQLRNRENALTWQTYRTPVVHTDCLSSTYATQMLCSVLSVQTHPSPARVLDLTAKQAMRRPLNTTWGKLRQATHFSELCLCYSEIKTSDGHGTPLIPQQ